MKNKIIKFILYYISGFLLYKTILFFTESIFLKIIGLRRSEVVILWDSLLAHIIEYTITITVTSIILFIYDKANNIYNKKSSGHKKIPESHKL